MAKCIYIQHCGKQHKAIEYWLISQDPRFDVEILLKAECDGGHLFKEIYEVVGYNNIEKTIYTEDGEEVIIPVGLSRFQERPRREVLEEKWLPRLKTDLFKVNKPDMRETRPQVLASEYTLRIARGVEPVKWNPRKETSPGETLERPYYHSFDNGNGTRQNTVFQWRDLPPGPMKDEYIALQYWLGDFCKWVQEAVDENPDTTYEAEWEELLRLHRALGIEDYHDVIRELFERGKTLHEVELERILHELKTS